MPSAHFISRSSERGKPTDIFVEITKEEMRALSPVLSLPIMMEGESSGRLISVTLIALSDQKFPFSIRGDGPRRLLRRFMEIVGDIESDDEQSDEESEEETSEDSSCEGGDSPKSQEGEERC